MAGKSPRKHWKTVDLKSTGQLKTLEKKQATQTVLQKTHQARRLPVQKQNKKVPINASSRRISN